jgi:hypothetical protein
MTSLSVVCTGSRIRELCMCAVSLTHTHMCVQPLLQPHRRGGSAAHCCSTCPELHAPYTQVSAVYSLLARVRSSGARVCMVYTIVLCTGMKVSIRARHARMLVFGMSGCTYAWVYMTSHSVVCMGSRIRELCTCAVSLYSHARVRTAFGPTS